MDYKRDEYRDQYNFWVNGFVAMVMMVFAVYAIYITGGSNAMTQPLPPVLWSFLGLALVFLAMALFNGYRMLKAPRDTRLDDLIKAVNELKWPAKQAEVNAGDSKPKITINIDTADISKMNTEQLKAVSDFINQLTQKETSK